MRFKKIASGFLIGFGILFLLAAIDSAFDQSRSPEDQAEDTWACLLLGLPMTTWGGWLAWELQKQKQQQERDRLRTVFFHLLQQGHEAITTLQFAMQANITGAAAKQFLDQQAREFSANFEVDDEGEISYRFNPGQLPTPAMPPIPLADVSPLAMPVLDSAPASGSFSVILVSFPANRRIAVIKVIRELTGCGLKQAVNLVNTLPRSVKQQVGRTAAEQCQQRLEAVGAVVQVSDRSHPET